MRKIVTHELRVFLICECASRVPITAHSVEGVHMSKCPARTVVRFRHLVPKAQKSKVILYTLRMSESCVNCGVLQQKELCGCSIVPWNFEAVTLSGQFDDCTQDSVACVNAGKVSQRQ